MAQQKCPRCGGAVRSTATKCEFCGKRFRYAKSEKLGYFILALFVVFVVLAAVFSGSDRKTTTTESAVTTHNPVTSPRAGSSSPSEPTSSVGTDRHISGDSWYGCTDRDFFKKLTQYAVQGDQQAWTEALTACLLAGDCTIFKDGEVVHITDTAIFSGLIKVRRQGELTEYWTNIEAVH